MSFGMKCRMNPLRDRAGDHEIFLHIEDLGRKITR